MLPRTPSRAHLHPRSARGGSLTLAARASAALASSRVRALPRLSPSLVDRAEGFSPPKRRAAILRRDDAPPRLAPGWRLARILLALLLACARSIAPARAQTSPASGFAFAPPVAPVLTHTSGPGAEVASTYFFDDFRRYHYVSTRVTTPDNVASGSQLVFQWGEVASACGGLIAFISGAGTLVFGVNCNTASDSATYAGQLSPNTDYLLEFYYDAKVHVAKIWVDGALASNAITGQLGFNWNDGPISVGMIHNGAHLWSSSGTIHEVSFYEWGDAPGFAPPVAPVLTHTSGPGAQVASTYFFDDFRRYHYVSTRVTTPDSVASGASQLIFQWGEVASDDFCGGLIAFFHSTGALVFQVNCDTASDASVILADPFAPNTNYPFAPNTDYLLEFYYDAKEHVAKIWVDGALKHDATTGQLGFNWNDGPISVGMIHGGYHPWSSSGTIHEVSFYEWGDVGVRPDVRAGVEAQGWC